MNRRVSRLAALVVVAGLALPVWGAVSLTLQDPTTGKAVVVEPGPRALHLVFFATWCPTCVDELHRLGEFEARWEAQGYRLVLVAVQTRQSPERLADFVAEKHPPGRLLFDAGGNAERTLEASRLPTHVVFDSTGREIARSRALDDAIEDSLADLFAKRRGAERGR